MVLIITREITSHMKSMRCDHAHRRNKVYTMTHMIDASHSLIEFSVKHMMVSTVKGRFDTFSGDVEIDEANLANSKVDVTIQTASLNTNAEQRDGHLRSADFFDA